MLPLGLAGQNQGFKLPGKKQSTTKPANSNKPSAIKSNGSKKNNSTKSAGSSAKSKSNSSHKKLQQAYVDQELVRNLQEIINILTGLKDAKKSPEKTGKRDKAVRSLQGLRNKVNKYGLGDDLAWCVKELNKPITIENPDGKSRGQYVQIISKLEKIRDKVKQGEPQESRANNGRKTAKELSDQSSMIFLPAKCEAFLPQAFLKHTISEDVAKKVESSSSHGQDVRPASPKFWVVYSDRADNTTYSGPSTSSGAFGKLDFNEKVRIAKISGDFALVYNEPQEGIDYPKISSGAKSKGWVPLTHLLLWRTCPTNRMGIYPKAILPDNNAIYFIMKRHDKKALLASQYKMDGATEKVLLGWYDEESFIEWDTRLCLEPNWDPEVVDYCKARQINAVFYSDSELSTPSLIIPFGKTNSEDNNPYSCYRMNNKALRYPVLSINSKGNGIFKCVTFVGSRVAIKKEDIIGYTRVKDSSDRDYWKPIIYISTDELSTLISQLQGVNAAAQQGDRKPYVDAMKALVRSMLPDISSAEMDAMGVQEVMNLITGLNASTQALKGPTLVQVQDPKAVSNAGFQGMVTRFQQKYNGLKKIKNDKNYKYSLMINNTKYYWIPVEDMP